MFCNLIAVGLPPKPYALAAYHALLEEEAPGAPWMIAGVSADLRPLFAIRSHAAAIFASALRTRRLPPPRPISNSLKRPCESCAVLAQSLLLRPRCGRPWLRPRRKALRVDFSRKADVALQGMTSASPQRAPTTPAASSGPPRDQGRTSPGRFGHGATRVMRIKAISKIGARTFAEPALRLREWRKS